MTTVNYGFIITRDHFDRTVRRLVGPKNTALHADNLIAQGVPFRLLDGNRRLCYEGMYLGCERFRHSPLDDFGEYRAGCTIIQYPDHVTQTWADL